MDPARRRVRYDIAEYVRLEEYSNVKHEFVDGQIIAMAGGTPEHGAMSVRAAASLLSQLQGRRCNVYNSDVRIRVQHTGLDTYPDASVVCGSIERDADDKNAILNPTVIVEVTSKSTESYDRGDKLDEYKTIPSVREIVLLSHREPAIDVVERTEAGEWITRSAKAGERIELRSIACTLDVDELYRDPLA